MVKINGKEIKDIENYVEFYKGVFDIYERCRDNLHIVNVCDMLEDMENIYDIYSMKKSIIGNRKEKESWTLPKK
jgi:3-dehydroquinate dehydratase